MPRRASCSSRDCARPRGPGRRSRDGWPNGRTPSRWTCAATACRTHRPMTGRTTRTSWPRTSSPSRRVRAAGPGRGGRPGRPRRSRVRGDRRGLGRGRRSGRAVPGWCWSMAAGSDRRRRPASTSTSSCATLDEPPEVMASMRAFLRDRRGFDPSTWDVDQETAARAEVVETRAGRVVPTTRPHALEASVRTMFGVRPAGDAAGGRAPRSSPSSRPTTRPAAAWPPCDASPTRASPRDARRSRSSRFEATGHNLMRYRPADVTAAILSLAAPAASPA